jgi:hypothetical protein
MREPRNFSDIHEEERQDREQNQEKLGALSGFSRLSPKQRSFILNSLYIQQRADRGTDPASLSRIHKRLENESFAPNGTYITGPSPQFIDPELKESAGRYYSSQQFIMNEYCHKTVNQLEGYGDGETAARSWYDAGPLESYEEVKEFVALVEKSDSPPLVIEIWYDEPNPNKSGSYPYHTTLLLGQDSQGEFVVWEKSGFNMPFQLTSLEQIYNSYSKCRGWRMRPLSV